MKVISHTYGLKTDLLKPEFISMKKDLEMLNKGRLAWSRQWEYPWIILQDTYLDIDHIVLDAGGGHSVFQRYLCKKVKKVVNVDIDPAIAVHEQELPNFVPCVADVRHMPFPENNFDAVFCISVLEHVGNDPMETFNECMRVLKPGCRFYLTVDVSIEPSPYQFSLADFQKFASNLGIVPVMPTDVLRSREFDVDCHVDQLAVYGVVVEK